jgi:hypothetical protein
MHHVIEGQPHVDRMGNGADTAWCIAKFQMPMVIEGHGGHPVAGRARLSRFDSQCQKGVSELTGTFVPLAPGKPEIFTNVIPINYTDVIRIHFQRSFHKGGQE